MMFPVVPTNPRTLTPIKRGSIIDARKEDADFKHISDIAPLQPHVGVSPNPTLRETKSFLRYLRSLLPSDLDLPKALTRPHSLDTNNVIYLVLGLEKS